MTWVLSLARSGGTAGSQDGHETRRQRVCGALFASVFASVLLAACGGGSGGNLTTSSEPEPGPPGPGPLTATGGGDGQGSESENEQQQQIIIVNQEEEQQQEIVVNIQPEPEEESEEEESEEEEEQQQRQLTIIEEPEPTYIPPEKKKPRYSAATQATNGLNTGEAITDKDRVTTSLGYTESLSFPPGLTGGGGFPYGLEASERFSDNKIRFLTLSAFLQPNYRPGHYTPHKTLTGNISYKREDGFKGIYIYEGETGELTGDVDLNVNFSQPASSGQGVEVIGNISTELEIEGNDLNGIVLAFGQIDAYTGVGGLSPGLVAAGGISFVNFGKTNFTTSQTDLATMHDQGQGKIRMVLSPDGRHAQGSTPESYPSYIAGEVEINGFKIDAGDRDTNTLVGAFIGDNQEIPPRKIIKAIEGSIGMFSYGIWAKEDFDNNYIRFLEETTKFNPARTASDYTAHTYHQTGSGIVDVRYKREDGFKGAYIYEGETGELTGGVDLYVIFGGFGVVTAQGDILADLEIGGYDLKGIAIGNGRITGRGNDNTHDTGVGGIDIDADGFDDSNTAAKFNFGDYQPDLNNINKATVNHHGLARKVRLVLSPDGIQAQGSTPETYPSQIAGELEINQFKIKESDGDNNTIVGVFVADKQE